jgi:hypothetical protein
MTPAFEFAAHPACGFEVGAATTNLENLPTEFHLLVFHLSL